MPSGNDGPTHPRCGSSPGQISDDVVIVSPIFSVFSLFLLPGLTAEGTMVGHELRARLWDAGG